MKENDVDGRKAAQTCQCIQPSWLAGFHELLDVSGLCEPQAIERQAPSSGRHELRAESLKLLYAVTSDPTFSPITTRRIFPGRFMLKMIIGRLLSLHRLTAVRSITFRPWRRISM